MQLQGLGFCMKGFGVLYEGVVSRHRPCLGPMSACGVHLSRGSLLLLLQWMTVFHASNVHVPCPCNKGADLYTQ